MPQLTDRALIRALLDTDRSWAAYALADLEPGFFEHTTWFRAEGEGPALALVYDAFARPTLITVGDVNGLRAVLRELDLALNHTELYVVIRPEVLPILTERYELTEVTAMQRMVVDAAHFRPAVVSGARRLGPGDCDAVLRLCSDGVHSGEAPAWFLPEMVSQGVYYGVWEAQELIAIAGTHIVAHLEGVGCMGNIYTRRDRRGRGLSTCVTSAVTTELINLQLPTIVLNVRADNAPAIRVYERLGFQYYCTFIEAVAKKRT